MELKNWKSWINPDAAPEISPETLNENLGNPNLHLIDVRRPDEFNGELGHIDSAKLVTLESEFESALPSFDKNSTYIFICRSGARSTRAALMAQEAGIQKVFNMQGGMLRWNALGLPIKKS